MSRFTLLLFFLVAGPLFAEPEKPRLVVLVVFDQMRGDYLEKWKPRLFQSASRGSRPEALQVRADASK